MKILTQLAAMVVALGICYGGFRFAILTALREWPYAKRELESFLWYALTVGGTFFLTIVAATMVLTSV